MDAFRSAVPAEPSLAMLLVATTATVGYCLAIAIYRLFFHPIAHFPGPKLAGLTRWYEFYYELIQKGQMTFHIQDLHKKYGEFCNEIRSQYALTRKMTGDRAYRPRDAE